MTATTIIGVFNSRQQADDALYALRNQLEGKNVSMILRSEQIGSSGGGKQSNLWNQLTQEALQLGGTMAEITGRYSALAMTTCLTLPATMIRPMMQTIFNPMAMATMMTSMPGNSGQNSGQTANEQYTITLQSEQNLPKASEILLSHGAKEINTYPTA